MSASESFVYYRDKEIFKIQISRGGSENFKIQIFMRGSENFKKEKFRGEGGRESKRRWNDPVRGLYLYIELVLPGV